MSLTKNGLVRKEMSNAQEREIIFQVRTTTLTNGHTSFVLIELILKLYWVELAR